MKARPSLASAAFALLAISTSQAWGQTHKFFAGDAEAGDEYGTSTALSGLLATDSADERALVGAPGEDTAGPDAGAAYVLERDGCAWSEMAKLVASDGAAFDRFGSSVALSEDTAVVGAPEDDDAGSASGAVYVFELVGSTWMQTAKLVASDASAGHRFGTSVSLSGDRIVVGAPLQDSQGVGAGAAYVFERFGALWVETAVLVGSDTTFFDNFGTSVTVEGDRALIGAPGNDAAGIEAGSAYVFEFVALSWVQTAALTASDAFMDEAFGSSVSLSGERLLVGASLSSPTGTHSGAAYVFVLIGGAFWLEEAKLVGLDTAVGDMLGSSVDLEGDLALVGAPFNLSTAGQTGAAYVFERSGSSWSQKAKLLASDVLGGAELGTSVALAADTYLVGAPGDGDMGPGAGAAYVFCVETCPVPLSGFPTAVSAVQGGTQDFTLNAGASFAGSIYFLLGTISGTAPGVVVDSLLLPLNPDSYFLFTLDHPNVPPLTNSFGFLDGQGSAAASIGVPPGGIPPGLIGQTMHHAYALLITSVIFTSCAVPLDLEP